MSVSVIEKRLNEDIDSIDRVLSVKDRVREDAIRITREILRYSTEAVRLIHLGKYGDAWNNIVEAGGRLEKLRAMLSGHPDLYYSGLVYNSVSEYVEAYITYKLIIEKALPPLSDLHVHYVPYLQGLGDVVGELRRHVLSLLDKGLLDEAEYYLEVMERIYLLLRKLNYPDALVPGLRHKVDVARRLIDDTRVLVINTRNAKMVSMRIERLLGEAGE